MVTVDDEMKVALAEAHMATMGLAVIATGIAGLLIGSFPLEREARLDQTTGVNAAMSKQYGADFTKYAGAGAAGLICLPHTSCVETPKRKAVRAALSAERNKRWPKAGS